MKNHDSLVSLPGKFQHLFPRKTVGKQAALLSSLTKTYIYILKEAPLEAPAASPSDLRWCFWPLLSRFLALPPIDSRPFDGRHRHICWSGRPLANKKKTSKSVIFTFPPSSSSSFCRCCSLAWERCVPPPPVYFGKEAPLSPRLLPARPAEA